MNLLPLSSPLAQRYEASIGLVCRILAQQAGLNRAIAMMLTLVWVRLRRMLVRLDRLALRWRAGESLAPRAKRAARPVDPAKAPRKPRMQVGTPKEMFAGVKLPRRRAWLLHLCQPAAWGMQTVEQMLADPEVIALVAAAPQAGRILRPLAHMYGIALPVWLRLPKRARKPQPPKPPRPESRTALLRRFRTMPDAELAAWFHPLPPHFNLPIPGYRKIRRRIRAFYAAGGVRAEIL
jgi:hypothetical protein